MSCVVYFFSYYLGYFYWDVDSVAFTVPFIDLQIAWYGVIFAFGFAIGYWILYRLLICFFSNKTCIYKEDILDLDLAIENIKKPLTEPQKQVAKKLSFYVNNQKDIDKQKLADILNNEIAKDSNFAKQLAKGFSLWINSVCKKAYKFADKLTLYIIVATIVGARLGHYLFYEDPRDYLMHPLEILKIREGGLASHGAVIAIFIAIFLFCYRIKDHVPKVSWISVLDLLTIPAAFVAFCIRIGNFVNQEILGTKTNVFWAVVFGHPKDGSIPMPRHPVQLYEGLFYLFVFFVLLLLVRKTMYLFMPGRLIGYFLTAVFFFRFVIEFFKKSQSEILSSNPGLLMGQYLSIPFILIGVVFILYSHKKYCI